MAEVLAILTIVGFGLSLPGIAASIGECGKFFHDRIRTWNKAPQIINELQRFGGDLHKGILRLDIERAQRAFMSETLASDLKDSLDDYIQQLRVELLKEKDLLDTLEGKSLWGKAKLTGSAARKAKELAETFDKWQTGFSMLVSLVERENKTLVGDLLLSTTRFRAREYEQLESQPHIFLAQAEFLEPSEVTGMPRVLSTIIERGISSEESLKQSEMQDIAQYLCYRLAARHSCSGVLRCLGYRMESDKKDSNKEVPELIFRIPEGLGTPRTLRNVIASDEGKGVGGGHASDFRFKLARELCEAVLSVLTAELVHKNIRPEAIVLFQPLPVPDLERRTLADTTASTDSTRSSNNIGGFGQPFLIDWRMVRKTTDITRQEGSTDWITNMYRHPSRQGTLAAERFNFGHDLYSLGVCLLEIGLWESLVKIVNGQQTVSDSFKKAAAQLDKVSGEELNVEEKLRIPAQIKEVLMQLTKDEIPPRMGLRYKELIVACLDCLDHGDTALGESAKFKVNSSSAGLEFHRLTHESFSNISF